MTYEDSYQYEGYENEMVIPGSGFCYKGLNTNDDSNDAVYMVYYHVDTLTQFQYMLEESGDRGNFGGWLGIRINMGERPVIFLGQYAEIFK